MRIERELFFWMGGVFCLSIEQALYKALKAFAMPSPSATVQTQAKKNAEALALGKLSTPDFCGLMAEAAALEAKAAELESAIVACLTIDDEALRIVTALEKELRLRLIVDLPQNWAQSLRGYDKLAAHFDHPIALDACGLDTMVPQVFELIQSSAGAPMQQCVVLDSDIKRCVASIRFRLPAAIILSNYHLTREFRLRGLLDQMK